MFWRQLFSLTCLLFLLDDPTSALTFAKLSGAATRIRESCPHLPVPASAPIKRRFCQYLLFAYEFSLQLFDALFIRFTVGIYLLVLTATRSFACSQAPVVSISVTPLGAD